MINTPRIVALASVAVALIAILQVETSFGLSAESTYDASSSITIFRNATLITMAFFALSFVNRWLTVPGLLTSLFCLLAMGTYLAGPGSSAGSLSRTALSVACVGLVVAVWSGVMSLRSSKRPPANVGVS